MSDKSPAAVARDIALESGFSEADAYYSSGTNFSVKVFGGKVDSFSYADFVGLGVRVISDGRVGYAYTEKIDETSIRRAVGQAGKNAENGGPNAEAAIYDYPEPPEVEDIYLGSLAKVPAEEKVALALNIEKEALSFDERIINVPHAAYVEATGEVHIANTRGVERSYSADMGQIYCMTLAQSGEDRQTVFEVAMGRDIAELDAAAVARKAAEKSISLLGAGEIDSGKYCVVFDADAFSDLFGTFAGIFSGKAASEGRSPLAGRLGQKIASGVVTIVDDATVAGGPASRPFDGEGQPSRKVMLVNSGTFGSMLHNTESAKKLDAATTAHATRGYKSAISVGTSNLIMQPGQMSQQELIDYCPPCVFVTALEGLHSGCNPVSGEFSVSCRGFLCEDGGRRPIHNFTVSGDFIDMLGAVTAVGSDFRFSPDGVGNPSVLVQKLDVAGR